MTTETSTPQRTPGILIVDDAPHNLELLANWVRQWGYEPRPVPSGKLALAAALAYPPDLILLDIQMPEMDGFEVCALLKSNELLREIPVIFLTALTETADKLRGFSMGAVDYVTKPFQAEEVVARIRAHLNIRSLQLQLRNQNENLERLVSERTRELARAYERLTELSRLKNDFLRMISHELRTPVNGVLGSSELIIGLCPPSDDYQRYSGYFRSSTARLLQLLEDVTMIADLENGTMGCRETISLLVLLSKVRSSLPQIRISLKTAGSLGSVFLRGDPALLQRAMETMIHLATCFSQDRHQVDLTLSTEASFLQASLALDSLLLSEKETAGFLELESPARAFSAAETLGLAPVVAQKIIATFGGELRLTKGEGRTGSLDAAFLRAEPED